MVSERRLGIRLDRERRQLDWPARSRRYQLREEIAGTTEAAELGAYHSALFETDATFGGDLWGDDGRSIRTLPALKLDPLDAGASVILASASILDAEWRLQAFTAGLAAVLPAGTPVTIGARILFVPGAAALWPIVLRRWLRAPQ